MDVDLWMALTSMIILRVREAAVGVAWAVDHGECRSWQIIIRLVFAAHALCHSKNWGKTLI